MKKLMIMVAVFLGGTLFSSENNASEVEGRSATFDLFETDSKSYDIFDENGEEMTINIEKIPSSYRISKGKYKITKVLKGKWSISFNVSIDKKEHFTSATNLNARSISGSFTSTKLSHTKNSALCSFKRKVNTTTVGSCVKTSISKGKLIVS